MAVSGTLKHNLDKIYSELQWDITPEKLRENTQIALEQFLADIQRIEKIPKDQRTFENTIHAFDEAYRQVANAINPLGFLSQCSTDKNVREAAVWARQKSAEVSVEVNTRPRSFEALKEWKAQNENVTPLQQRLFNKIYKDFLRNGLELSDENLERLKKLRKEIADLEIQFRQNLAEVTDTLNFSPEDLEGVPDTIVQGFKKADDGKFVVGMSYPEVFPILEYAKNPQTRKRMMVAFGNRAGTQNTPLLQTVIKLRHDAAKILGYKDHAEYIHEIRMVGKSEVVNNLQYNLASDLKESGKEDLKKLLLIKKEDLPEAEVLEPFDLRYYSRIHKERTFNLDQNKLKEYFPTDYVVEQMLNFYQEIFSLSFIELENAPTWHPETKSFLMEDEKSGKLLGLFYIDLFPREGKFSHAAVFPSISRVDFKLAGMLCNFNKATSERPSLLTHSQVTTLFHEFGHIVDFIVSTSPYYSLQSVKWDFIEAPSQMLENWLFEKEILSRVAKHYETSDPLPSEDVEMLKKSRSELMPTFYLRQLSLGIFDMRMHTTQPEDVNQLYKDTFAEFTGIPLLEETKPAASFGHMMGGYPAGYYTYLWSKIISSDLFTKFQKDGITSTAVGLAYRKWIMEQGDQIDQNEAVENFLGRPYNSDAFKQLVGITSD